MRRRSPQDGYSLVEVTLALLVAGLGLVALFALFPEGMSASRKSVDATEVSAFADYVFSCLEGEASSTNPSVWAGFDSDALPVTHSLDGAGSSQPRIVPNGGVQSFYWIPDFYGGPGAPGVQKYRVAQFTYTLTVNQAEQSGQLLYARLEVWPGDVSNVVATALAANDTNYPRGILFYREYGSIQ